jgi:hypothetical protein
MTIAEVTLEKIDNRFDNEFIESVTKKFLEVFGTPDSAIEAIEAIGICGTHGGDCPKVILYRDLMALVNCRAHKEAAP